MFQKYKNLILFKHKLELHIIYALKFGGVKDMMENVISGVWDVLFMNVAH